LGYSDCSFKDSLVLGTRKVGNDRSTAPGLKTETNHNSVIQTHVLVQEQYIAIYVIKEFFFAKLCSLKLEVI